MPGLLSDETAVDSTVASASGLIKNGPGAFYGLVVIASSSGNLAFHDATSAAGTSLFTKAVAAGDVIHFGGVGQRFNTALYLNLVSGTATVRVLHR